MEIKLHTRGKLLNPEDEYKYIYIHDDTEGTGGYYVYFSRRLDTVKTGHDTWVEEHELEDYIKDSGFIIKWLD